MKRLTAVGVVFGGLCLLGGLCFKYYEEQEEARRAYLFESEQEDERVAEALAAFVRRGNESLRTIARLPELREVRLGWGTLPIGTRTAITQIFGDQSRDAGVAAIHVAEVGFDPDATGSWSSLRNMPRASVRAAGPPPVGIEVLGDEQLEVGVLRAIREQLAWLGERYPRADSFTGNGLPVVGSPEIRGGAEGQGRAGVLVFSMPYYGMSGALHGCVSGVVPTAALAHQLADGGYALLNPANGLTVFGTVAGQAQASAAWVRRGEPDPELVHSGVVALPIADDWGPWQLWSGRPEEEFWSRPEVVSNRVFFACASLVVILLTLGAFALLRAIERNSRLSGRRNAELEERVRERTAELAAQGMRRRMVVESALDAVVEMDQTGRIVGWNGKAEGIFGWSAEEAVGRSLAETLIPAALRANHERGLKRFLAEGTSEILGRRLELMALHRSGREFPVELSIACIPTGEATLFSAYLRDITERKRAESDLRRAKEMAEAANRAKSEFLANMSHEIRTPLNGVIGMTGLLLDTDLDDEQQDYAQTVRNSGEILLALINDILDFSKIEAGRLELETADFDLRSCLEEVGDILWPQAQQKGLELAILIDHSVCTQVRGDSGRLRQVLLNLTGNAIKFTEKGEVLVRAHAAGTTSAGQIVRIDVQDTGIGIPDERRDRLFKAFSQVDASTTRRFGGTGLGLAICRRFVEAMGGAIAVDSDPGRGSTFSFTVPLDRSQQAASEPELDLGGRPVLVVDDGATNRFVQCEQLRVLGAEPHEVPGAREALEELRRAAREGRPYSLALLDYQMPDMDGTDLARAIRADREIPEVALVFVTSVPRDKTLQAILEFDIRGYLVKPVKLEELRRVLSSALALGEAPKDAEELVPRDLRAAPAPPPAGFRVLIVEDNAVNQRVAQRMLEKAGYRCDLAGDGHEAVEAFGRAPYDLILMDCQMPEMDGYEATMRIRSMERAGSRACIIAMTADALQGVRERCLATGMDDYVTKPVTAQELYRVIERNLRARKAA